MASLILANVMNPMSELTIVDCVPRLVSIIAGDSQYSLLYRCTVDVFDRPGGLQVLLDGLVHHQVLELSELGADVRQPSGAHVRRLANPAGKPKAAAGVLREAYVKRSKTRCEHGRQQLFGCGGGTFLRGV